MNNQMDRRGFLRNSMAGVAAAVAGTTASRLVGHQDNETSVKPVRVGVVGVGGRGRWHIKNLLSYQQEVIIPAICDYRKDRLATAVEMVKQIKGYTPDGYSKDEYDYRNMFQRDDLDGILVLTPMVPMVPELAREIEQVRMEAGLSVKELLDGLREQREQYYDEHYADDKAD